MLQAKIRLAHYFRIIKPQNVIWFACHNLNNVKLVWKWSKHDWMAISKNHREPVCRLLMRNQKYGTDCLLYIKCVFFSFFQRFVCLYFHVCVCNKSHIHHHKQWPLSVGTVITKMDLVSCSMYLFLFCSSVAVVTEAETHNEMIQGIL